MRNTSLWLFRVFILLAIALLVISWFLPWWNAAIDMVGLRAVQIHPYGLTEVMGRMVSFIHGAEMPVWFAPLAYSYLGVSVICLLYSVFRLKEQKTKWILSGVGVVYVLYIIGATVFASIRVQDFGMGGLLGKQYIINGPEGPIYATGNFELGYYLAFTAGILCILLGLLRAKFIKKEN